MSNCDHFDWNTVLMTISTGLLTVIGYFQYRITSLQNSAQVSIFYDANKHEFILKNYGNLKAKDIRILCQHIEIKGEFIPDIHPQIYRSRNEPLFAQEEITFSPDRLVPSHKSSHPQFLICVWKFQKILFGEFCHRIFLKMPNEDNWLTANETLVHHKQWEIIDNALTDLKRRFDELANKIKSKQ